METIIGFAAGYLVGAKEGRAGFDRLKSSVQAIAKSPEARKMAAEAMSLAGVIVRQTSARGIGTSASEAAELVLRRISSARQP